MDVYKTTDYNKFIIKFNRPINPSNVNGLIRSFRDCPNAMNINPVVVSPSMIVIDGQHRIEAAKRLNMPVHYTIDKTATDNEKILDRIKFFNVYQRPWEIPDFIHHYAQQKMPDYQFLLKMQEKYKDFLNIYSLIFICETEFPKEPKNNQIKAGKITIKNQKGIENFLEEVKGKLDKYSKIGSKLKNLIFNRLYTRTLYGLYFKEWEENFVTLETFFKNCARCPDELCIPCDLDQAKKYVIQMARLKPSRR